VRLAAVHSILKSVLYSNRMFVGSQALHVMQEVPQRVTTVQGMHIDFFAATGSLILLAALLAISFERILGLDRIFAHWFSEVRRRSKLRQLADLDATKQRLEQLLQDGSTDET